MLSSFEEMKYIAEETKWIVGERKNEFVGETMRERGNRLSKRSRGNRLSKRSLRDHRR
jgi:hypothetical protein